MLIFVTYFRYGLGQVSKPQRFLHKVGGILTLQTLCQNNKVYDSKWKNVMHYI
jgi:hypothetical protein